MEFSVKKFDLLEELTFTQGVVERKTTIPILSHLLCEAKGNRVTITATDLELSIRTSCEAKVKKEGAGTIPAKKLLELIRLLPEGEIKFKLLENHWVQIVSDRKTYKMVGMSKDNFPALPAFPHALVKLPARSLATLIAKTTFAISPEESRYTLNGALLVLKPDDTIFARQHLRQRARPLARRLRVQFEAAPDHLYLIQLRKIGERRFKAPLADVTPGADHVRPDFDFHVCHLLLQK